MGKVKKSKFFRKISSIMDSIDESVFDKKPPMISALGNYVEGRRYSVNYDDDNAVEFITSEYKKISPFLRFFYHLSPVLFFAAAVVAGYGFYIMKPIYWAYAAALVVLFIVVRALTNSAIRSKVREKLTEYINEERRKDYERQDNNTDALNFVRKDLIRNCPKCGAARQEDETECVYCGTSLYVKFSDMQNHSK